MLITDETAAYLRRLAAQDPEFADGVEVVNIDLVATTSSTRREFPAGTMVFDLSDGTTIRIDFERYRREVN